MSAKCRHFICAWHRYGSHYLRPGTTNTLRLVPWLPVARAHQILRAGLYGFNVKVSPAETQAEGKAYRRFKESRTPLEFRQHHHEVKSFMEANGA